MADIQTGSVGDLENTLGGPGQAFSHFITMEDIIDKLKVLNYDKELVKDLKIKPLNRHYFALQTNPGEQFYLFTSLASWLIRKCGRPFEQPQEYDDPNSTISSILDVLREFNVPVNFPPNRLKQGYGENAIYVLNQLTNEAIKCNNVKWLQPEPTKEVEEEQHEVENESELILEKVEEEMATFFSDDDDENILNLEDLRNIQFYKGFQENQQKPEVLESTMNSEEWLVELEKVLPQLKITVKTDSRDWRNHLEQMQKYNDGMEENLSLTRFQLDKLYDKIVSILDKVSTREKYLNNHLEPLLVEYRNKQDELSELTEKLKLANEDMSEGSKVLTKISEELENVKREMEERGSSMTDGTPLINIKKAISKIKGEVVDLDIRIGVLVNEILQGRLRDKTLFQQDVETPSFSLP